jgi:TetR/AcrR family transcriptional repressor of nem operon
MPDVLHFDVDKALDDFLEVFWHRGYRYTSTKELARSAGISEGSLFNTFGSKREIYLAALKHYRVRVRGLWERMEGNPSALDGIRQYWETLGRQAADPAITQGCMITNATLDLGEDDEIQEFLHWVFSYYDKAFKKALDRAVKLGELKSDTDTTALAQYLSHSAQGLRVMGRLNPSRKKVANIVRLTLETLDQYRA